MHVEEKHNGGVKFSLIQSLFFSFWVVFTTHANDNLQENPLTTKKEKMYKVYKDLVDHE